MILAAPLALLLAAAAPAQPSNPGTPPKTDAPAAAKPADAKAAEKPADAKADAKADANTPAAAKPAAKADPKVFDEALKLYFDGDHEKAARELFAYAEGSPATDENHTWAEYFLGRDLVDLGLREAGGWYLAKVARERGVPQAVPRALEALHLLTRVPHDETMVDQQIFGSLDLGFLPPDVQRYVDYEQGLYDLKVGNERWARTHFAKLDEGSAEASKASFALLVGRLRKTKAVPDEMVADFAKLADDDKLTDEARNDARLAVARLDYERKQYDDALGWYGKVKLPPLDPGRATLYLEEAWTYYRLGKVRESMGLLQTLDAPSFRDAFIPDKFLLRAMIYRDLCQYLPAKRAARELLRHYADSLEAIHQRDDLTRDSRIRAAADADGETKDAFLFRRSLELEGERLSRFAGPFGDRLFAQLSGLYDLQRAEAERTYHERLDQAVRDVADRLLGSAEQERLLEYEVGLKLYERVKKGQTRLISKKDAPLKDGEVVFPFDGEYWNDELRDYRVSIQSRCLEEDAQ